MPSPRTDPYGLYSPDMDTANDSYGCNIEQSGVSGSYTYSVAVGLGKPPGELRLLGRCGTVCQLVAERANPWGR